MSFFASKANDNGGGDYPTFLEKRPNVSPISILNISPLKGKRLNRLEKISYLSLWNFGWISSTYFKKILYLPSKLLNNLFEIEIFPDSWKIAHVIPIFKRAGSENCKSNYRPISILPSFSKVCESIMIKGFYHIAHNTT